jgi:hypothetical protein
LRKASQGEGAANRDGGVDMFWKVRIEIRRRYQDALSPGPAYDPLEQLSACEHLHDDVEVLLALVQPLHADDVRVVH